MNDSERCRHYYGGICCNMDAPYCTGICRFWECPGICEYFKKEGRENGREKKKTL